MNRRILAWILCALLMVTQLFSFAFILHSVDHACSGKDCSICASVRACVQVIRLLGLACCVLSGAGFMKCRIKQRTRSQGRLLRCATLVQLKVKLSC